MVLTMSHAFSLTKRVLIKVALPLLSRFLPARESGQKTRPGPFDAKLVAAEHATEPSHYGGTLRFRTMHEFLKLTSAFVAPEGHASLETCRAEALLAIHSLTDGVTYHRGSTALYERLVTPDKLLILSSGANGVKGSGKLRCTSAWLEDDGQADEAHDAMYRSLLDLPIHHCLTREPAGGPVCAAIAHWVSSRATKLGAGGKRETSAHGGVAAASATGVVDPSSTKSSGGGGGHANGASARAPFCAPCDD
jgi:hypothetical protein